MCNCPEKIKASNRRKALVRSVMRQRTVRQAAPQRRPLARPQRGHFMRIKPGETAVAAADLAYLGQTNAMEYGNTPPPYFYVKQGDVYGFVKEDPYWVYLAEVYGKQQAISVPHYEFYYSGNWVSSPATIALHPEVFGKTGMTPAYGSPVAPMARTRNHRRVQTRR